LTCYGSTSVGYDSNLTDIFISYTGYQPRIEDKESTLEALKSKALSALPVSTLSRVSSALQVGVFPHVKVSETSDSINCKDELKKE
jgi:hypothetical protein